MKKMLRLCQFFKFSDCFFFGFISQLLYYLFEAIKLRYHVIQDVTTFMMSAGVGSRS